MRSFSRGFVVQEDESRLRRLVETARAAVAKAFLTSSGGTAYGAAVLTSSGKVFSAGQYSSFNHVTNVHAEQAALVMAVMNDDPDVVALALASTAKEPVTRPCGVCCQVMDEHRRRTGRDFEVLMAHADGVGYDRTTVSGLLSYPWVANSFDHAKPSSVVRCKALKAAATPVDRPRVGDHVQLSGGAVAMVWDEAFDDSSLFVKVKYVNEQSGGYRKVAHSFSTPLQYHAELQALGVSRPTQAGFEAPVYGRGELQGVLPAPPADAPDLEFPGELCSLLELVGIDMRGVRVTGSRGIGLEQDGSDWDLIVPIQHNSAPTIRNQLARQMQAGRITIPESSGSWRALGRIFPGGISQIVESRRFLETFRLDDVLVALIFVPNEDVTPLVTSTSRPIGRACLHGTVVDAGRAIFKRAEYRLQAQEYGEVRVVCYYKLANLLQAGDRVAVRGWLMEQDGGMILIQTSPIPDNIVWHHA